MMISGNNQNGVPTVADETEPVDILHPEVLSTETLFEIIKTRHIQVDESAKADKGFLVNLFHRTVTPLPQRVPRGNRRGSRIKKVIKRLDANKPKTEIKAVMENFTKSNSTKTQSKGGLRISADIDQLTTSRLKPPPIVIRNKKIVKLGSGSTEGVKSPTTTTVNTIRTGLTKVKLSNSSSNLTSEAQDITRTKIKLSGSKIEEKSPTKIKRTPIVFSKDEQKKTATSPKLLISTSKLPDIVRSPAIEDQTKPEKKQSNFSDGTPKQDEPSTDDGKTSEAKKSERNRITYSNSPAPGKDVSSSGKPKLAARGKDAVLRALYGSPTRNKEMNNSTKVAIKRAAVKPDAEAKQDAKKCPSEEEDVQKKKRKISWP